MGIERRIDAIGGVVCRIDKWESLGRAYFYRCRVWTSCGLERMVEQIMDTRGEEPWTCLWCWRAIGRESPT